MNDEINKLQMEYIREHVDDVKKVCDGCPLNNGKCEHQITLLCTWFPSDYKCNIREFFEKENKGSKK